MGVVTLLPPSASDREDLLLLTIDEGVSTSTSSPIVSLELRREETGAFIRVTVLAWALSSLDSKRASRELRRTEDRESCEECEPRLSPAPEESLEDMDSKDFFLSAMVNEEERDAGLPSEVIVDRDPEEGTA